MGSFFPRGRSSHFLKRRQPITHLPSPTREFQMETKNDNTATVPTWTPFSRKTFLQQQARGKHSSHCQHAQYSIRLLSLLQHLSYLHAMWSSHTPFADCLGHTAHSLTHRLQLEIRKAFGTAALSATRFSSTDVQQHTLHFCLESTPSFT